MLKAKEDRDVIHAGNFMLVQGEVVSNSALLGQDALEAACSLDETWEKGKRTWQSHYDTVQAGYVVAAGVYEQCMQQSENADEKKVRAKIKATCESMGFLYKSPPCRFCDYGVLCGKIGGGV